MPYNLPILISLQIEQRRQIRMHNARAGRGRHHWFRMVRDA